ncbi:MAG: DUF1868 domain-containing protein [Clostridia bacterium]|nr:DUF1868 domain-containing protein [Oscillospiraceae bacterium]MBQ2772986.1 DUF1868 domain-containing protein [Clostridia bacterium]MBQ3056360.1 DUF1868 domain-containing protein [Clostridia bacterium]
MTYGSAIGTKFYENGDVRTYPGNTVVADVTPDCPAYDVMVKLHQLVIDKGLDSHQILLPKDSYHMTVIRGVNDQVRKPTHWPKEGLAFDAPMTEVDDYITKAVTSVPMPKKMRMKFDRAMLNAGDIKILLVPADEEQAKILKDYRDAVANAIGLFLPGHDEYRFHITLSYTRVIAEGDDAVRMDEMLAEMDRIIKDQPDVDITAPYMAYYNDMLAFSPTRLPRK